MTGVDAGGRVLDRRVPTDFDHVEKYGASRRLGIASLEAPQNVEVVLQIPRQYRVAYDQGVEGACVGFSQSWLMSILNRKRYDALQLYREAQQIDEWGDTPPEGGTSLRAGFDVLRTKGHWRYRAGKTTAVELDEGIEANVWIQSSNDVRACIAAGKPVNFGINWYRQFSTPIRRIRAEDAQTPAVPVGDRRVRFDYWISDNPQLWGPLDGGHAITAVAWSDIRDSAGLLNTWGDSYPFIVWLPRMSIDTLLRQDGEAGIVVDRIEMRNP